VSTTLGTGSKIRGLRANALAGLGAAIGNGPLLVTLHALHGTLLLITAIGPSHSKQRSLLPGVTGMPATGSAVTPGRWS
jgi:hypothetical protein